MGIEVTEGVTYEVTFYTSLHSRRTNTRVLRCESINRSPGSGKVRFITFRGPRGAKVSLIPSEIVKAEPATEAKEASVQKNLVTLTAATSTPTSQAQIVLDPHLQPETRVAIDYSACSHHALLEEYASRFGRAWGKRKPTKDVLVLALTEADERAQR